MEKEFADNTIKAAVEQLPHCMAKFKVLVNPEEAKKIRLSAAKSINKEVSIPGFRKGKAPQDLIEKQYGKHIDQEFREQAVKKVFSTVISLSKIYPLQKDVGLDLIKFAPMPDGTIEIEYQYEVYPEVPDVNTESVALTSPKKEDITDEDIEKTIREIKLYHAEWNVIEDRPVQEDDFVVVDIDIIDEPPFKAYENSRFQVKDKWMPEWARKLVIGLKSGESAEGVSDESEGSESRKCRITVKMIQEGVLPEVNDDLAKKAGADSVEDLKANIRKQLEKGLEKEMQEDLRNQARDYLIKNYAFELPKTDLKNLEEDCRKIVERDKEFFKSPEELKTYKDKLLDNGIGVVQLAYLIPHIAKKLEVNMPTEEEINQRLIEIITHHYLQTRERVPEEQFDALQQKIRRDLIHEKTLDQIIEKNLTSAT